MQPGRVQLPLNTCWEPRYIKLVNVTQISCCRDWGFSHAQNTSCRHEYGNITELLTRTCYECQTPWPLSCISLTTRPSIYSTTLLFSWALPSFSVCVEIQWQNSKASYFPPCLTFMTPRGECYYTSKKQLTDPHGCSFCCDGSRFSSWLVCSNIRTTNTQTQPT